jgi:hypothetical protein
VHGKLERKKQGQQSAGASTAQDVPAFHALCWLLQSLPIALYSKQHAGAQSSGAACCGMPAQQPARPTVPSPGFSSPSDGKGRPGAVDQPLKELLGGGGVWRPEVDEDVELAAVIRGPARGAPSNHFVHSVEADMHSAWTQHAQRSMQAGRQACHPTGVQRVKCVGGTLANSRPRGQWKEP